MSDPSATDPVGDLRNQIDALEKEVAVLGENVHGRLDAMRRDVDRIEAQQGEYVTQASNEWVVWAVRLIVGGLILATLGAVVSLATRSAG